MTSQPEQSLAGKTCLITGATAGIGRVAALEIAKLGARLLVVGRSAAKVEAIIQQIRAESTAAAHAGFVADLSSFTEIRRLAEEVQRTTPRLDILINNAGAMSFDRVLTVDGVEHTFALNHLAYYLLTDQLRDLLAASAPARIINVASGAHRGCKAIAFDDLNAAKGYQGWRAYCHSKLANVLFTRELARRLEGTGVTANCLHPGFVRTDFFRKPGWRWKAIALGASLFAISPEAGAATTIYLAASPDVAQVSGRYFVRCRAAEPSIAARDDAMAARLWSESAAMTAAER